MNYQITIRRTEPNPNFADEEKNYRESSRNGYHRDNPPITPQAEVVKNVLVVELTEDQYEAIKKSVLETFK